MIFIFFVPQMYQFMLQKSLDIFRIYTRFLNSYKKAYFSSYFFSHSRVAEGKLITTNAKLPRHSVPHALPKTLCIFQDIVPRSAEQPRTEQKNIRKNKGLFLRTACSVSVFLFNKLLFLE